MKLKQKNKTFFYKHRWFLILIAILVLLAFAISLKKNTSPRSIKQEQTAELTKTSNKETAKVVRVIDGDTIEIEGGKRIRYIGINTPEIATQYKKSSQCYGVEAKKKNSDLVAGKEILLEKDVSETDQYGRLLRYVWIGEVMVNETLVAEGYAKVTSIPPDLKYQNRFSDLQKKAKESGNGLWNACFSYLH